MAIATIISGAQHRSKDSYSASPTVGLALRSNGEEKVSVIDRNGNVFRAGIDAPTVAPTGAASAGGTLPAGKWAAYLYVYASSRFPFVENALAINGQVWPRSNSSPATPVQMSGGGNRQVTGLVTKTVAAGIDTIWLFRTAFFATMQEAQTAGDAGAAYYQQTLANSGGAGTVAFTDNNPVDGTDQVETDNFVASQFQFNVFYDPYWWGFGNLPFAAPVSWDNTNAGATGKITLTSGVDSWFDGRNGQNLALTGIVTGGFDGNGTFLFKWLTSTTATVTIDGVTPVALPSTGAGTISIQGPATTLYRSKPRNPFSWGLTETIGSANVPEEYAFKIGGGLGSALAVVPSNATLKLDCEYPARCFTLNLRSAGTSAFEGTLRIISDIFSVSAHFSQFAAATPSGNTVLWGWDCKNFAILQSDGVTQTPVSIPIPQILRGLSTDRTRQLLAHGVYDPRTELNCMWVPTLYGLSLVNYLIYQHAPSGFWGFANEQDLLASAAIQDTATGQIKTFVGTETGFFGQALVDQAWSNWLPSTGLVTGAIVSATSTSITTNGAGPVFNTTNDGIIGNWVLITDPSGQQEQLARVSAVTAHTLTFDWIRSLIGGGTTAFNPVPAAGWMFYIGLIECRLLKYFDFEAPQTDKSLMEIWLTQQNSDPTTAGTLIRYYRERENTYQQFATLQNTYEGGGLSDAWFQDTEIPAELVKMFGLEIINRGYQQWKFVNMTLKPTIAP